MKVTIEIKTLMDLLEAYNPTADLTGVKAYLFDLVIGGSEAAPVKVAKKRPSSTVVRTKTTEVSPAATPSVMDPSLEMTGGLSPFAPATPMKGDSLDDEDESPVTEETGMEGPPGLLGTERSARSSGVTPRHVPSVTPQSPAERRKAREDRRKGATDLASMSTKDILANLTGNLPKPNESGQFTNMGIDGAGGDDVEIG